MGEGRNSYSKTDTDATFMQMKEDRMRNGQQKLASNVQLAVNSEHIAEADVFSNRTDVVIFILFMHKLEIAHKQRYEEVTADAGYESLDNDLHHPNVNRKVKPFLFSNRNSYLSIFLTGPKFCLVFDGNYIHFLFHNFRAIIIAEWSVIRI